MTNTTECPICDAIINLAEDTVQDELLPCHECGSELIVSSTEPFVLDEAPQAEEDWGE
ncbi:MAG: lysine biosynthesis protein LysW [Calditrichia bacterium]|jgi:lysine biosynthesis protein LysW